MRSSDRGLDITIDHDGRTSELEVDHLIFAIGRDPSIELLDQDLNSKREKLIEEGLLYLIGDVKNGRYRQTIIAMGDDIKAAMKIAEIFSERPE